MRNEFPGTLEQKMRLVENLDERIARAKALERKGLIRNAFIGAAMFTILGAWPNDLDPLVFNLFRYGSTAVLVGSEFLIRRFLRRRLEAKQEKLLDQRSWAKAT
jgi:hypothetical protein